MLLRWKIFCLMGIVSLTARPSTSETNVRSRQKRGGLLNLDVRLDLFRNQRRQQATTSRPEARILPLPPGTDAEDHGIPIKDESVIQHFIKQLESYRKRNSGLDSFPILSGIIKTVRRFQACATPKLEKGHCRHVQHCVLPAFLRNINVLLSYACFIGGAHLGVCCPDRHFDESIIDDGGEEEPTTTTKRPGILGGLMNPLTEIISPIRPTPSDTPSRPDIPEVINGSPELQSGVPNDPFIEPPYRHPSHGRFQGPPQESPYNPYGIPDKPPHRRPHGSHRHPPYGRPPRRHHHRPPHQGRPAYEPDYYPDANQGTANGRPSERLEFTTESSRFPLITSRYDKAEENDGRFVVTLSTTVIRDSPFIFNAGSSTDMYTYSTKTKYPWESTIAWSKEPSYEDDKQGEDVSSATRPYSPPTSSPTYSSAPTTTSTQTPQPQTEDNPANGSQITKYSATCGLGIKSRIVGGEVANVERWAWVAALMRIDKRTNQMEQFCGGVVISNRYIITAAHCLPGVHPRELTIRLGEFDFSQHENSRRRDYHVSRIVRHPQFNESNNNFADIALIKVNEDIAFNQNLLPVCMPEEESFANKEATVIGWGVTSFGGPSSSILMQLTLPVWDNAECQDKLNTIVVYPQFLCAGLKDKGGHDSCQGDSGGPLMVENSNRQWSLIGIVSWGFKCAQKGIPAIYTRVTEFRDWIYKNAA
ncbi:serine proteinase stubble-like isoform X1 [Varroa jacobsoni]|uniref:serine proteinase stubble-like isoform X1 n=1 Tax=Varroa jacobsoni TaxID=62625 RepID=UPI000BF2B7AD|nr:serine proteinase stubble-like isoform X1 [Varroa jacobsoni]XP_022687405.1 serine proteinase stubble-like isoform X1 [Varroa jacobsoni]XP_022687406.1 serine proteinase stubble-like isoform X1 [Varroa jacobsoni]